jgi:hypothetical protein
MNIEGTMNVEDADILANHFLEDMIKIKIDIENAAIILESLKIKYKNILCEYSKIYKFTTDSKENELVKLDQLKSALEIDKLLFLERQQNKLGK